MIREAVQSQMVESMQQKYFVIIIIVEHLEYEQLVTDVAAPENE